MRYAGGPWALVNLRVLCWLALALRSKFRIAESAGEATASAVSGLQANSKDCYHPHVSDKIRSPYQNVSISAGRTASGGKMTSRQNPLGSAKRGAANPALAALVMALTTWALPAAAQAQDQPKSYGIAAKRPVLQASCKHCPWGALGDILKTIMAPAYD